MVYQLNSMECMEYLRTQSIAVLATISSKGLPMASTLYFVVDGDFNFYFTTKMFTRKYQNLINNPNAALVVGTENEPVTVQIEGTVRLITDKSEIETVMNNIIKVFGKNRYVAPLFQLAPEKNDIVVFKLTPNWIRWLDQRGDKADSEFVQIIPGTSSKR